MMKKLLSVSLIVLVAVSVLGVQSVLAKDIKIGVSFSDFETEASVNGRTR